MHVYDLLHTWLHVCKGNSIFLASSSSACTFSLFDCSSVPFHILVCLFSICFSDVALFCGFYSRRTTLWPLRTCLILSRSVNFSRVHWRLVAGSGTLLDPLWRKVPEYKHSCVSGLCWVLWGWWHTCSLQPFQSAACQTSYLRLAWLAQWERSLWTPVHVVITSLFINRWSRIFYSLSFLFSPFYSHRSFTRVLVILVIS